MNNSTCIGPILISPAIIGALKWISLEASTPAPSSTPQTHCSSHPHAEWQKRCLAQASHQLMFKTKCRFRRLAQKGKEGSLMHDLDQNWVGHNLLPKPPEGRTVGFPAGHSGSPCIWDLMSAFLQASALDGKETEEPGRRKRGHQQQCLCDGHLKSWFLKGLGNNWVVNVYKILTTCLSAGLTSHLRLPFLCGGLFDFVQMFLLVGDFRI